MEDYGKGRTSVGPHTKNNNFLVSSHSSASKNNIQQNSLGKSLNTEDLFTNSSRTGLKHQPISSKVLKSQQNNPFAAVNGNSNNKNDIEEKVLSEEDEGIEDGQEAADYENHGNPAVKKASVTGLKVRSINNRINHAKIVNNSN